MAPRNTICKHFFGLRRHCSPACASLGTPGFGAFGPQLTLCPVLRSSERLVLLPGGSLEIGDIAAEDAGTYTCLAENGNDTIEAQAELSVQGGAHV